MTGLPKKLKVSRQLEERLTVSLFEAPRAHLEGSVPEHPVLQTSRAGSQPVWITERETVDAHSEKRALRNKRTAKIKHVNVLKVIRS